MRTATQTPAQTTMPTRRALLLHSSTLAPLALALAVIGTDDTTTIVNSVLGAYGLPSIGGGGGGGKGRKGRGGGGRDADFRPYDELEDDYFFEYPRSWVARPNTLRPGVVVSNFQTADKASVEVLPAPEDGDVQRAAVAAAVLPGGGRLTQDDLLSVPPPQLVKSRSAELDGQRYLYLTFPSETVTRSGYQIERRNVVVAAERRGRLYVLSASARGDQYDAARREALQRIVESFRLR